jgi:ABC-type branched-subunit amino acid transport system substrate-binding protein
MNYGLCRFILVGVMAAVVCMACAPRPKPELTPFPKSRAAADQLFQQAEKKYQASAFPEALVLFNEYLSRYPDEPLAPAALMRIGGIHGLQGNHLLARKAYARLMSDYPSSSLRTEAMLENMSSLLGDGYHQEVVGQSAEALKLMSMPAQRTRAYVLLGDAQAALGAQLKAVEAYTRAMKLASPTEQELLVPKLRSAILHLSREEVQMLAQRGEDDLPMDYLLFQAGMLYAREGRAQDALVLLKSFRGRYPGHEHAERAAHAMAEAEKGMPMERRVLGCLLPLTGAYQSMGQRALRGIELAVSVHNSSAGVPPVQVIVKDTGSDAGQTLQALQELERENVSGVIGPLVHAEAINREAQRMGMPIIAVTQKEGVVGVGDYVFRNFITPLAQMRSLVSYAVGHLGVTHAVILYPDETYGRTFMGLFRDEFQARGGEILTAVAYSPEATDFSASIKKLLRFSKEVPKEPKPERKELRESGSRRSRLEEKDTELVFDFQAVFIPDEPKKAGMLVPQLHYHDIKNVYFLGTNLWHSETLIKLAEPYVQGAIMPDAFFAGSPEPSVKRFVAAFEGTYQEKPGFMEAIAYDSAMILFEVLSRPDVRLRSEVAAALRSPAGFPGATGLTRFDPNGDSDKILHILEVRGKRFVGLD